jgi:mono/diheme cytochrome c family protein
MPVLARALFLLVFAFLLVGGIVVGFGVRRVNRRYDHLPLPPITRATAPEDIARGGRIFRTNCLDCHAGSPGVPSVPAPQTVAAQRPERRPVGARVTGAPAFLGEIWAPNLTTDPEAGIGAWTDGELARLLRNGVRRDGHYAAAMPRFARLADEDVAALIGFLRSDDPLVAAAPDHVPRSQLGVAGTLALAYAAGVDPSGPLQVPAPARGPTAAYGRYLASSVYGCVDCHTHGFVSTEEKLRSPTLLAGGLYHRAPNGEAIYSTNLTADPETGLGKWTAADLERALTIGIGRDGLPVRAPMPVFRYLDAQDAAAVHMYLRSLPPINRRTPGPAHERPAAAATEARLFAVLACAACHGKGAPYRAIMKQATQLPLSEIGAAIRHPEQRFPGTQMPTYATVVDDATALRLAAWIKSND